MSIHRRTVPKAVPWWRRSPGATAALAFAFAIAGAGAATPEPAVAATPTAPPPLTILSSSHRLGRGDIFITPTGDASTYANGPEIVDRDGNVVWFHAIPPGPDRRRLPRAELPRSARADLVAGHRASAASPPAPTTSTTTTTSRSPTVNAGNGLSADGHEFLITPQNTALILAYTTATANLTSIGGPADQTVIDGVVQEIDIATGKVLFQWNSADHVPYSARASSRCRRRRARRGTGSTSTQCTSTPTATC